jgi:hypothetical protein
LGIYKYALCDKCFGVIRTQPDSYGWTPDFVVDEEAGKRYCGDCVREDEDGLMKRYLRLCLNNPEMAMTLLCPSVYGFYKVPMEFKTGLHLGQNDDPEKVSEILTTLRVAHVYTCRPGESTTEWEVWVKTNQYTTHHLADLIVRAGYKLPYDPGTGMDKVLRGKHSDVYKVVPGHLCAEGVDHRIIRPR